MTPPTSINELEREAACGTLPVTVESPGDFLRHTKVPTPTPLHTCWRGHSEHLGLDGRQIVRPREIMFT